MARARSLIMLLLLLLLIHKGSSIDECRESSCGPYAQNIRFPFQLVKESSQDQCIHPEFCLYCTENKETMMVLSTTSGPIKFLVNHIDYESNRISVMDPDNCIPIKFLKLNNSSFLPYLFESQPRTIKYSFFNCSSVRKRHLRNYDHIFQGQDMITCPVYVSDSHESVLTLDLVSCIKMFDMATTVTELLYNSLSLSWPKKNCTKCEANGMKCKWKNNGTKGETECFDCNKKRKTIQIPKSLIYASTG